MVFAHVLCNQIRTYGDTLEFVDISFQQVKAIFLVFRHVLYTAKASKIVARVALLYEVAKNS